ncbi:ParB-like nuclease [Cynara cardunculus var. scolymus]|uniref:sulfiredoxin n=1 Tax=Cynara cardunculus var. scolymus TaxID=59895 RepID=A0A103Y6A7_CYNCS|nr:ParB-like nuclease [Cynara cardunculus var. scolymus]
MARFLLQVPNTLRNPSVFASSSSNGSFPTSSNQASQSGKGGPLIIELPLNQIRRPLMRTRTNDQQKVQDLMDSIAQIGLQVPIDVLEVDGAYYGITFVESGIVGSKVSFNRRNPSLLCDRCL